jgi:TP901 family phage tail tape measure protein
VAIRATEVVIIAKVMTQGSASLRRLGADMTKLGAQAKAAQALDVANMKRQRQVMQLAQTNARLTQGSIRQTRDLAQLEKELFDNQTQRWRARQRIARAGGDPMKLMLAQRDIEASYKRQNILLTRRNLLEATSSAETARLNAQLKMQELQLQRINAEYAEQMLMQKKIAAQQPFTTIGRTVSHAGRAGVLAGGIGTIGFASAAAGFAEFDRAATRAATQSAETVAQITFEAGRLERQVLRLMKVFPASQQEMTAAAYDIYSSLNVTFGGGIRLLELFNKAAVGGQVDLSVATEASITVLENFDRELANNGKITARTVAVMDQMFGIVKLGRMSFDDMQQIMSQVAPAAHAANQEIEDVSGAVSLLTRKIGVNMAGAGLARLFEVLGRRDFRDGMRKAGLAIDDISGNLIPLPEILERIHALDPSRFNDLIQVITAFGRGKGQGILSTVQARRALTELIDGYDEYLGLQTRATTKLGEFQRSYEALAKTPGVQWQVMINQLKAIGLEIGRAAIPAMLSFFAIVGDVAEKLMDLDRATGGNLIKFAAWASIIMLIAAPLAILIGSLVSLIGLLRGLAVSLGAAGGAGALGRLGALAGILRFLGTVGVVTVGVHLILNWEDVKRDAKRGDVFSPIADALGFGDDWDKIKTGFLENLSTNPIAKKLGIADNFRRTMIEQMMEAQGLDATSIKGMHDQWFKMTVKDRKRIFNEFKSKGLGKELLHRVSVSTLEQAFEEKKIKEPMSDIDKWMANLTKNVKNAKTDTELQAAIHKSYDDIVRATEQFTNDDVKELKKWREDRANVIKQATEDAQATIERATDALVAKYNELRAANQSAFGGLFEGPWMTSETMTLAKDWGIKPGMQDLTRDVREQRIAFQKWNAGLSNIAKRGAPKDFIEQLRALGPEGMDIIGEITRSSPAEFNKLVNEWKKGQAAITAATEVDFKSAMATYKTYGKDVVTAIIEGLDANDRILQERFSKLIKDSFGAEIMSTAINDAVAEWEADNPRPTGSPGTPAGGRGGAVGKYAAGYGTSGNPMHRGQFFPRPTGGSGPSGPGPGQADDTKGSSGAGRGPVYNTYNYNLYGMPTETPDDFVRRAAWRLKKGST